ncbi:hypothetical protein [Desulfoplanes sp.]
MNHEQKHALLTGILVLALLIGGGLLLTVFEDLKNLVLIGLLILAGIGCLVQGRSKSKTSKPSNLPDK